MAFGLFFVVFLEFACSSVFFCIGILMRIHDFFEGKSYYKYYDGNFIEKSCPICLEDFKENDIKAMRLLMEKSITDMWKTNPELVYYRINKVNLIYKYNDKFGKHLFEFSFNAHEI